MESLYTKYGGHLFWESVLEKFYVKNLHDPALRLYFEGKDINSIRVMYRGLLSAALKTSGDSYPIPVKRVHKYMNISNAEFETFLNNLANILLENGITRTDCEGMMAVISSYKDDIVKD